MFPGLDTFEFANHQAVEVPQDAGVHPDTSRAGGCLSGDKILVCAAGPLPVSPQIKIRVSLEEIICDLFDVGPGDIYRIIEASQWLIYAAGAIANLNRKKTLTMKLEDLRNRIKYGIKEELLEITQLKGVGRIRARGLYKKGFKKLSDFKRTNVKELGAIKR